MGIFKQKRYDFTEGGMIKPILMFSMPILFGNIFNVLYNIVDSIVVGQFVGSYALAAVNASFAIAQVCTAVYAGFGMGAAVLMGQIYGAKQNDKLNRAASTAILGAIAIGLTMSIIGQLLSSPLLALVNTPEEIVAPATTYLRIYLWGCATQLLYFMGSAILRSLGNSQSPMYYLITCAIINIVLDVLFVTQFNMGCGGVALATVIAQAVSAILVVRKILTGGFGIHLTRKNLRIDFQSLKMMLNIGFPSMIQQMTNAIGLLIIQSCANSFGTNLVAANGVIQKVDTFAFLPLQSVGQTITTFNAQNLGAGKMDRVKKGNRQIIIMELIIGILLALTILSSSTILFKMFINVNDPGFEAILIMGSTSLKILAFFYILHAMQHGIAAIMTGAGATRPIMLITIASILVRVAATYALAMGFHRYQNLYWATDIFYVVVFVGTALYYRFGNWKQYVQVKRES